MTDDEARTIAHQLLLGIARDHPPADALAIAGALTAQLLVLGLYPQPARPAPVVEAFAVDINAQLEHIAATLGEPLSWQLVSTDRRARH